MQFVTGVSLLFLATPSKVLFESNSCIFRRRLQRLVFFAGHMRFKISFWSLDTGWIQMRDSINDMHHLHQRKNSGYGAQRTSEMILCFFDFHIQQLNQSVSQPEHKVFAMFEWTDRQPWRHTSFLSSRTEGLCISAHLLCLVCLLMLTLIDWLIYRLDYFGQWK